jgi:TAG lipase/steryl ester hydrolase/phospholipase A2/LPA acyltransferase
MSDFLDKVLDHLDKILYSDLFNVEHFRALFDKLLIALERLIKNGLEYVPIVERVLVDTLDAMFAPKQMMKQAALIFVLQLLLIGWNSSSSVVNYCYHLFTRRGREEKQILDELANVKSYTDWKLVASKLDTFRQSDKWRKNPESSLYDYKLVKKRIEGTKEMLERGDVFDLMFRLRGALARDQFGIQHEGLFNRALGGSKYLVEHYHETMARALNFISDSPIADEEVPTDAKLAFFNETRHAYGRTALL